MPGARYAWHGTRAGGSRRDTTGSDLTRFECTYDSYVEAKNRRRYASTKAKSRSAPGIKLSGGLWRSSGGVDGILIGEASATIVIQREPYQRCVGVDTVVPNVAVASMGRHLVDLLVLEIKKHLVAEFRRIMTIDGVDNEIPLYFLHRPWQVWRS